MAVKYIKRHHDGDLSYKTRVSVVPNIHTYTDNYTNCTSHKYSCPICDSLGMHLSITPHTLNCSICGINLNWDYIINKGEMDDDESLYVG